MAQRLNECPKCGKYQYTDIVVGTVGTDENHEDYA